MGGPEIPTCPRDGSGLILCSLTGCSYWWCDHCDGLLLEPDQLSQLRTRALARLPPPHSQQRLDPSSIRESTARCVCQGAPLMVSVREAQIVSDICRGCGRTWLDGGDIHQLLQPALFTGLSSASTQANAASSPGSDSACDALLELALSVVEVVASAALDV